ncbi:hypothetical protein QUF74_11940 [Candidatus Halobeggiatoa sp. HSG11]|nr:hypothetical protein [Candidatus Halobeggiatoa sp. HSG11]
MEKNLLAFLIALQNTELNSVNEPNLKELSNELELLSKQTAIITEDWQNIQADMDDILTQHSLLNTSYHKIINQLNNVEITIDLLPTLTEIEAIMPADSKIKTLGGKPGQDKGHSDEINNVLKISKTILNNENPQEASKTLLKQLYEWLQQSK